MQIRKVFESIDDELLPDNILAMEPERRQVFIDTFNSSFEMCLMVGGEDGDCEAISFANAYMALNTMGMSSDDSASADKEGLYNLIQQAKNDFYSQFDGIVLDLDSYWVEEVFTEGYIVVCDDVRRLWRVEYEISDGTYIYSPQNTWVEVEEQPTMYQEKEMNGKKNTLADIIRNSFNSWLSREMGQLSNLDSAATNLDSISGEKDVTVTNTDEQIVDETGETSPIDSDVVSDSEEGKSFDLKIHDDGRIEGLLVRFTDEDRPDLDYDFFAKDTDYGVRDGDMLVIDYHHGYSGTVKNTPVGEARLKFTKDGISVDGMLWVHTFNESEFMKEIIESRAEYKELLEYLGWEEFKNFSGRIAGVLQKMAKINQLGWSSDASDTGVPVERTEVKDGIYKITKWHLKRASLTPSPAEPENEAYVKSINVLKNILDEVNKMDNNDVIQDSGADVKTDQDVKNLDRGTDEVEYLTLDDLGTIRDALTPIFANKEEFAVLLEEVKALRKSREDEIKNSTPVVSREERIRAALNSAKANTIHGDGISGDADIAKSTQQRAGTRKGNRAMPN